MDEKKPPDELESFEVTELDDIDLEDVSGGVEDNSNCGCNNDNCGCGGGGGGGGGGEPENINCGCEAFV